ncbi:MAG: Holliday junction resolvase RuvX [Clostridia bacterium]|nr:Holliday junction resolvase RuvX [Clostridia bacterium]MBR6651427.1 Holliday junction resolvase RuvX [Clostridia bacterium]
MTKILLGVDYGDARTGLATNAGTFAFGAGCVRAEGMKKTAQAVADAAIAKKAELIVVGNPLNMNGTEGPRSEKCRAFAAMLEEMANIPVVLYDERLTTVNAHNILSELNVRGKKRKDNVDELSATLILQAYIDSQK